MSDCAFTLFVLTLNLAWLQTNANSFVVALTRYHVVLPLFEFDFNVVVSNPVSIIECN